MMRPYILQGFNYVLAAGLVAILGLSTNAHAQSDSEADQIESDDHQSQDGAPSPQRFQLPAQASWLHRPV